MEYSPQHREIDLSLMSPLQSIIIHQQQHSSVYHFLVGLYLHLCPRGRTDSPSRRISSYTDPLAWNTERLFWFLGLGFMSRFSILFELGSLTTNCALRYGFWLSPLIHPGSLPTQHACASRWLIRLCSSACLIWIPKCPQSFIHLDSTFGLFLGDDFLSGLMTICRARSLKSSSILMLAVPFYCPPSGINPPPSPHTWTLYYRSVSVPLPVLILY